MPSPRTPLDPSLEARAFRVSEALASGMTVGAIRHHRHQRIAHGVISTLPPLDSRATLQQRTQSVARALLPILREGEAFSHTTALLLLGCPIRCDPVPHISTPLPATRHQRKGVRGHACRPFDRWRGSASIPIASPEQALIQAAKVLSFRELVVAIDHLVCPRDDGTGSTRVVDLDELRGFVNGYSCSGILRLRMAARFARSGAESRMETLLRLLMAQFGLDVLELQGDISGDDGRWIGRFDMVDRARRLIIEYDGEQHRTDRAQYLTDIRRLDRVRAAGYRVLRVHREDVLGAPMETARRIAQFLDLPLAPVPAPLMRYFVER